MKDTAPIVLFVYDRLEHTQRAVDALRANSLASTSDLTVFSDGPRNEEDLPRVLQVRQFVKTIDGFRNVTVCERGPNLGLAGSVIEGVTRIIEDQGRVIVMEDDLVVAPGFLSYMNAALEYYQGEPQVMQIAGHMFPVDVPVEEDAFFLPFISSWGWGTWARAWHKFDPDAGGYLQLKQDAARRKAFDMDGAYGYFSMLEKQLAGKVDSWAILWNLSVFMNAGMVLYPKKTLVQNTGFDGSGVHTRGEPFGQLIDMHFVPARLPKPGILPAARQAVFDYFRARRTPIARLRALKRRVFQ